MLDKSAIQRSNRVVLLIYLITNLMVSIGYILEIFKGPGSIFYLDTLRLHTFNCIFYSIF